MGSISCCAPASNFSREGPQKEKKRCTFTAACVVCLFCAAATAASTQESLHAKIGQLYEDTTGWNERLEQTAQRVDERQEIMAYDRCCYGGNQRAHLNLPKSRS